MFASTAAFTPGQLNPHAYAVFGPVAAVSASAAVLITTELTRREIPYLLQPVNRTPPFSMARVWRDIASTFSNHDFVVLFLGALTYAGIAGTTDTLDIYVNTYFWGLAPEQAAMVQPEHRRRGDGPGGAGGGWPAVRQEDAFLLASFGAC